MMKAFLYSIAVIMAFYAVLIGLGWLDTGEQGNLSVLRNIFVGQYLFFTAPIFIFSMFVLSAHKSDLKMLLFKLFVLVLIGLAYYAAISSFLISKLNG